ncbi:DoxX family protein [Alkalihalobacillus sp. 1P02AB]|uniref:DoxX family protein n=1 Tax=Alkalihalobacillus sp. 1P02AB TaxID=3132260 RepID=UPI0039A5F53B
MLGEFLRNNKIVAMGLVVLRLVLGWAWLSAGWGKVTGGFNAGGYLQNAVANPVLDGEVAKYPLYVSFLENFAVPNAEIFSLVVAWGEVLVGLGLILGVLTSAAAFFGAVMNLSFLFAGTISSNPWMLLVSFIIIIASANAGRYGGDRYVLPYLRSKMKLNKRSFKMKNSDQMKEAV